MSLTNKQKAFIEEYLKDYNATRAAERAGYGGDDGTLAAIGCENLKKPKIASRIRQRLRESAMTADEVMMHLSEQGRGEHAPYITPEGAVDIARMVEDGKAHLVKRIRDTKYGKDIEFHDAQQALKMIGQAHGLFKERVDAYEIDLDKLTSEQLNRIAEGEDPIYVLATSGTSDS